MQQIATLVTRKATGGRIICRLQSSYILQTVYAIIAMPTVQNVLELVKAGNERQNFSSFDICGQLIFHLLKIKIRQASMVQPYTNRVGTIFLPIKIRVKIFAENLKF